MNIVLEQVVGTLILCIASYTGVSALGYGLMP